MDHKAKWRPALMYALIAVMVNNHIVAPYASTLLGAPVSPPEMPTEVWYAIIVYLFGRTWEKLKGSS